MRLIVVRSFYPAAAFLAGVAFTMMSPLQSSAAERVQLMTLDPGHFHAALVQKFMYPQVDPVVHVYAPDSPDLDLHLQRIEGFNTRAEKPTRWDTRVHRGADFAEKMFAEKPGNVVVLSGNNAHQGDPQNSPLAIYLNRGDNRTWTRQVLTTEGAYNSYLGDFEGDGDLDIFRYPGHMSESYELWLNLTR